MPDNNTYYSRAVYLVFNYPSKDYLSAKELQIVNGIETRWSDEQNDPNLERLHIIYMEKGDNPYHEKFKPLRLVDNESKIVLVGHCHAGSDVIESEAIYTDSSKEQPFRHGFTPADIGLILMLNIRHNDVIIERTANDLPKLHAKRKLKFGLPNCYAAADEKNIFGSIIHSSFALNFINFISNGCTSLIVCDVIAANALVIPIGTKPGIRNFINFVANNDTQNEVGFHVLYCKLPYTRGNYMFNLFQLGIRRKPGNDYKLLFTQSKATTIIEFLEGNIPIEKLNVDEIKARKLNQPGKN